MSFDIVVRVAAEGDAVITGIERGLDSASSAAARTSAAVSDVAEAASKAGAALTATAEGGSSSMEKARAAAASAGGAVDSMAGAYETALQGLEKYRQSAAETVQAPSAGPAPASDNTEWEEMLGRGAANLQREKDVLESIRGPMREYSADMDALARLYDKGQLSAAEYTNATDALIRKQQTMQGPVQQVTEAMKNEEKILQSIRGPMQQYAADMEALDALFKRGAIDLDEMSKKAEQLASKAGTMHGPVQQMQAEAAPAAGPSLDGINGITSFVATAAATGGALLGVAHEIDSIVKTMHDIEDVSIRATNAAQKFVDAQHSATDIMSEQLEVAEDLHASYDTTIKLYDKVREGSEGVALSHREQLEMTKTLGEAVQLSNKPIESAAALLSKFSFAMQSGQIEGRALKNIMREVPAIAELWRDAFHTNDIGLMDMVKHGKITIADLVATFANGGDKIHARFQNLQRTNVQAVDEFVERWKLGQVAVSKIDFTANFDPHALMKSIGISDAADPSIAFAKIAVQATASASTVQIEFAKMMNAIDDVDAAAKRADQSFTHWLVTDGIKKMRSELKATAMITEGLVDSIARSVGVVKDPWDASGVGFGAQVAEVGKIKGPVNDAKVELENLRIAMKSGAIDAEEFRLKYRTLATTLNDGMLPSVIKLWEEFKLPIRTVRADMAGLNTILREGVITWDQYIAKQREFENSWVSGFGDVLFRASRDINGNDAAHPYKPNSEKNAAGQHEALVAREGLQYDIGAPAIESARVYEQRLTDVDAAVKQLGLSQQQAIVLQRQARDAFDSSAEALSKTTAVVHGYEQALARLKAQRDSGAINGEQFQQSVGQLDRAAKLVEQMDEPLLAYRKRLADISVGVHDFGVTQAYANTLTHNATEAYRAQMDALDPVAKLINDLGAPLRAYNEQTRIADEAHRSGGLDAEKYADKLDEIRLAYLGASEEGKSFAGGAEAAWLRLKIEADSFGAAVATNLIGSVDKFNDAFVKAANDGTTTWRSFGQTLGNVVDGIVQDLEKMVLKYAEVQAVGALMGLGGSSAGSSGGGAADLGALAGLGIEGFAGGGSGIVGGSGGPDSQLVPLRLTPGELVTVTTPAQQGVGAYPHAAPSEGGGGAAAAAPAPIINVHVTDTGVVHAYMASPAGVALQLNTIRANPSAIRPARGG